MKLDTELDAAALRELTKSFQELYDFPADPREQLEQAIGPCSTRDGDRAVEYRRIKRIPDEWGTAVNVQQMVFGNKGRRRVGRGLLARRDHRRPEPERRLPPQRPGRGRRVRRAHPARPVRAGATGCPGPAQLMDILRRSSATTRTCRTRSSPVEEGRLYMLQTRNAKRPAQAAVRFAVDAVEEGLLTRAQAITTIDAASLEALLHPTFDPDV